MDLMEEQSALLRKLYNSNLKERLKALETLIKQNPKRITNGKINLHIHTNESFSVFRSPTEAVWHAYENDVEYFGINDHYTIDGHGEFGEACRIAGLKAVFSIEAIAMDHAALKVKRRYNDPNNPGRCYLIGKGVTRDLKPGGRNSSLLLRMRAAIQRRNREIVRRLNRYGEQKGYTIHLSYEDVRRLTPRGNATERHVVQAFCEKLDGLSEDETQRAEVYTTILGDEIKSETLNDPARLLVTVRAGLVKTGRPCYVEEDEEAFTSLQDLIRIYLEYGAVPSYPFMGGPVTEEEEDLDRLFEKVLAYGMYAFDLVEFRTPLEIARKIVLFARDHGFPVFIGTEHNTKRFDPMVGEIAINPDLYEYLKRSSQFVLGHQILSHLCDYGYVTDEGRPRIGNLREGFQLYSEVGSTELTPERVKELKQMDREERKRALGIQ
jgi:hypothetical protein